MKKLPMILEKGEDGWYGRIEDIKDFTPIAYGSDISDVEKEIRELIRDHQENDEPDEWQKVNTNTVVFEHYYDLSALFQKFDVLKINSVARIAGMNASLLRQYVSQKKFPGKAQAKRIENAIKKIAEELADVFVYVRSA